MYRVGQNHIYTVNIRYFWQGNHQIYGHIRCIYTVLANPIYDCKIKEMTHLVQAVSCVLKACGKRSYSRF